MFKEFCKSERQDQSKAEKGRVVKQGWRRPAVGEGGDKATRRRAGESRQDGDSIILREAAPWVCPGPITPRKWSFWSRGGSCRPGLASEQRQPPGQCHPKGRSQLAGTSCFLRQNTLVNLTWKSSLNSTRTQPVFGGSVAISLKSRIIPRRVTR